MTKTQAWSLFRAVFERCIVLSVLLFSASAVLAQAGAVTTPPQEAAPVLLLSDIHFEPFWDPGKVPQLAAAPVSEWKSILAAPPSPDRERRFQALEKTCRVRGDDTSPALLDSSFKAVGKHATGAAFAAVSGDLVAHAFSCKYAETFPHPAPGGYRSFVEKTISYVLQELGGSLPGVPLFVALGNNDSDCGDYRLDAHSAFFSDAAAEFTQGFPGEERQSAQRTFEAGGYYGVSLPAPLRNARLLVLNDLFMSGKYSTCAGKPDPGAASEQLAWLRQQLVDARRNNQKVWVMGHIPPGIDLHGTVTKMRNVCGGEQPEMFLGSEKMADELIEFGDVVQLAVFAHTHMDEMRLLRPDEASYEPGKSVALKMIPSISPINGNAPAFVVASVGTANAALLDYRVFVVSNSAGWSEEYDFAQAYRLAGFTAASAERLLARFQADPAARSEASRNYIRDFMPGSVLSPLGLVWPQYTCSLWNHTAQQYRTCVCPAAH